MASASHAMLFPDDASLRLYRAIFVGYINGSAHGRLISFTQLIYLQTLLLFIATQTAIHNLPTWYVQTVHGFDCSKSPYNRSHTFFY